MSKIYTKYGDEGQTMTLRGEPVPKNDCLIKVNGDIDSLLAIVDQVVFDMKHTPHKELLEEIRTLLWQLGGEVSAGKINEFVKKPIQKEHIDNLEKFMDDAKLDLKNFVRFNCQESINANEARVRTRRLERTLTDYLQEDRVRATAYKWVNRLSDYFFTLSVLIEREK